MIKNNKWVIISSIILGTLFLFSSIIEITILNKYFIYIILLILSIALGFSINKIFQKKSTNLKWIIPLIISVFFSIMFAVSNITTIVNEMTSGFENIGNNIPKFNSVNGTAIFIIFFLGLNSFSLTNLIKNKEIKKIFWFIIPIISYYVVYMLIQMAVKSITNS